MLFILFIVGLITGSFLSALTFRLPKGLNFYSDRSRCPRCKHVIAWFDNIPLLSYFLLKGRCRNCGKKISFRYPLIELVTAITFAIIGPHIVGLILAAILIAIFIIDLEHQIIPDELVFIGLFIAILNFQYSSLLAGFLAADFLLFLNLITNGKGMGLGDVKLAILIGTIAGLNLVFEWMLFSFVAGAIVGIILMIFNKATMKQKVAFGPFLIIGLALTLIVGKIVILR